MLPHGDGPEVSSTSTQSSVPSLRLPGVVKGRSPLVLQALADGDVVAGGRVEPARPARTGECRHVDADRPLPLLGDRHVGEGPVAVGRHGRRHVAEVSERPGAPRHGVAPRRAGILPGRTYEFENNWTHYS